LNATLEEGRLKLEPGRRATVGFILADDTVTSVRIQVLDAETDAIFYMSPKDIPVRFGGVSGGENPRIDGVGPSILASGRDRSGPVVGMI
jgi:hypothetical protein